jgi:Flp pilus assembly pilin Flp
MTLVNELLTKVWLGLRSLKDERGQDLMEYALLAGFIAVAFAVAAAAVLTTGFFNSMVTTIRNCLDFNSATACGPI